ncbi:MAG: hypothetical protein KGL39_30615 [Patescibacteria group bacterium]|nr:hypothetical protein [Patescibacteria group bacterium]
MNIGSHIAMIVAGGPGSGCNPAVGKCGRPPKGLGNVGGAVGRAYHVVADGQWHDISELGEAVRSKSLRHAVFALQHHALDNGAKIERQGNRIRLVKPLAENQKPTESDKPTVDKSTENAAIENTLKTAPIESDKKLDMGGMNARTTRLVALKDDGRGVFKTDDQHANEVVAYNVAKVVGMDDLVPPTVERTVKGKAGSLQQFQEGATHGTSSNYTDMARAAAFDMFIGNLDRHGGNYMIGANGKLRLIDNGFAYRASPSMVGRWSAFAARLSNYENYGGDDKVPSPKQLGEALGQHLHEVKNATQDQDIVIGPRGRDPATTATEAVALLSKANTWMELRRLAELMMVER